MDIIIEVVCEAVLSGILAVVKGKYPLWLKIPAIIIVSALFIAIIGLIGFMGIDIISDGNFIGGAVFLVIDVILAVSVIFILIK